MPNLGAGQMWGSTVPMGGQNQWMSGLPTMGPSGGPMSTGGGGWGAPTGGMPNFGSPNPYPVASIPALSGTSTPGGGEYIGHQTYENPTYNPNFTGQYYSMLNSLMGGSGGLQGNLLNFLMGGGSNMPGASSLANIANTGAPINQTPAWQQMVQAMGQNTAQQEAGLMQQFGAAGMGNSTAAGTAEANYAEQTTKDQNALLGALQTQALQQAVQNQLQAGTTIFGGAANENQWLQQLLSQGALAQPGLNTTTKGSVLGGVGSILGGAAPVGGSIMEGLAGGGGLSDVMSSLAGLFAAGGI